MKYSDYQSKTYESLLPLCNDATVQALSHAYFLSSIDSTNVFLAEKAQTTPLAPLSFCISDEQTHGKGRLGRHWDSPRSQGFYFSLYFQANDRMALTGLPLMVAITLLNVLQSFQSHTAQIKWPNDLIFSDKKFGGILLESFPPNHVIIGCGLNLEATSKDTTDLNHLFNKTLTHYDHLQLLANFLNALVPALLTYETVGFAAYAKQWPKWDYLLGKKIRLQDSNSPTLLYGRAAGINATGAFQLQDPNGHMQSFSSANISVRLDHDSSR